MRPMAFSIRCDHLYSVNRFFISNPCFRLDIACLITHKKRARIIIVIVLLLFIFVHILSVDFSSFTQQSTFHIPQSFCPLNAFNTVKSIFTIVLLAARTHNALSYLVTCIPCSVCIYICIQVDFCLQLFEHTHTHTESIDFETWRKLWSTPYSMIHTQWTYCMGRARTRISTPRE